MGTGSEGRARTQLSENASSAAQHVQCGSHGHLIQPSSGVTWHILVWPHFQRRRTQDRFAPQLLADIADVEAESEDLEVIPDERLRLIFVCCHPAVAVDARAALTLRLVCGLSTLEIARAFLVPEATLAQRLVRAKRRITEAGVPFKVPRAELWPERLAAVLSTLEVAYAKAHEDAAGGGPHANYALEILELTRVLSVLLPLDPEVLALAATTRYAEARRPSRTDSNGVMIPLSEQDPALWRHQLIAEANAYGTTQSFA
jgi:RNA polymerase sigma-70 factor, ECF subfamily